MKRKNATTVLKKEMTWRNEKKSKTKKTIPRVSKMLQNLFGKPYAFVTAS